ncbi:i-AAA protease yme1 [Friedmanniomyces endolithicus]|uniref:I-AAA protease yme1 n=1 Tax=Rachicladosporium monterosium TaxID=1507873 RepID=A0ABR0L7W6_9PEZI|nr:i-AAA protease yme1 [Friedmanniomyces endolithicus]KAK1086404.1 i-AAA protease yme1 [Friedmanniomyces endolithicus]KAK1816324.1 i-AAA protease yme1 [Friedmanniomyces endolithicus]KAK5144843.1 i-AAA protease yme1 [Rachicladosporium monterosium]
MAFQAPMSAQHIAAAVSETWPSLVVAFSVPIRSVARRPAPQRHTAPARTDERGEVTSTRQVESSALPDFMASVPTASIKSASPMALPVMTASNILSALPKGSLRYASPLSRGFASRAFSTTTRLGPLNLRAPPRTSFVAFSQQRTLFGSSWGSSSNGQRNLLGHLEQTANNNPGSATAQIAFYQALLRANMPEILVERYQTGRYASNQACENVYMRALERVGAAENGSFGAATGKLAGEQSNQMSQEQLQAIGQAVLARNQGGNVTMSKTGTGAKSEPLYVVVDESFASQAFKWVRFFVIWGFLAYFLLVAFSTVIDITGTIKKVTGAQNAEVKPELQKTRFSDVHGCDEAKEEVQELVEFLKNPEKFSTLGGKLPKGVLLVGPPGTGKTLLARAVAGEAGVPFFYMSGSEFDEVYVGVGAKRVRDLFSGAKAKSPAIIFIDELDAIGGKRHERDAAYAKQTLNQLLTELDGFEQDSGVIVIGATNFPESLDKALTRPGRFDRNVSVPLPDVRGRIAILQHHMKSIRIDAAVDAAEIARGSIGFSGAELENVVNQAAVHASKNKAATVSVEDLVWAKDKIMMGAESRSRVIQQKDKIATAYHEAGHALVAMLTEATMPLYKATIMPRGHALGMTQQLPEIDRVSETKKELLAKIDVCMGGKMAEELIYGADNVSTGASSDIQQATRTAHFMITTAGMSELLGNVDLESDYRALSPQTKQTIESEVRRLVEEGRERSMRLLVENREGLERLANALLEYETLSRDEMERVVRGEGLGKKVKGDGGAPVKLPEAILPILGAATGARSEGAKDGRAQATDSP